MHIVSMEHQSNDIQNKVKDAENMSQKVSLSKKKKQQVVIYYKCIFL